MRTVRKTSRDVLKNLPLRVRDKADFVESNQNQVDNRVCDPKKMVRTSSTRDKKPVQEL